MYLYTEKVRVTFWK